MKTQHIDIVIALPFNTVNAYLGTPQNFIKWASGIGTLEQTGEGLWQATTPDGQCAKVHFSDANPYGIADHIIEMENGVRVSIPLRSIALDDRSTLVVLTLIQQPGMDDAKFAADARWVQKDLDTLKQMIEAR